MAILVKTLIHTKQERAKEIYDFEDHSIRLEVLESGICSSSMTLIKLGFNLYNNFNGEGVLDTFSVLDSKNFELAIRAIRIRVNRNTRE